MVSLSCCGILWCLPEMGMMDLGNNASNLINSGHVENHEVGTFLPEFKVISFEDLHQHNITKLKWMVRLGSLDL